MRRRPPPSTLFPYTTLFRSVDHRPVVSVSPVQTWREPSLIVLTVPPAVPKLVWPPSRHRPALNCASPSLKRSEEHTSEVQSRPHLVCRLLLEKKKSTS